MENRRAVIIAAVIALVVAAVIVGAIILLTSLLRGRVSGPTVVTSSPSPVTSAATGSAPATGQVAPTPASNTKFVSVGGYTMSYPKQWGILKCSNSQSLEFDPLNGTDQLNVVCDYAIKPITILVSSNLSCTGETVVLGNNRVVRLKTPTTTGADYRWCLIGSNNVHLDITHRVSNDGSRATSKDDFSAQVEQIISTIRTGGAS